MPIRNNRLAYGGETDLKFGDILTTCVSAVQDGWVLAVLWPASLFCRGFRQRHNGAVPRDFALYRLLRRHYGQHSRTRRFRPAISTLKSSTIIDDSVFHTHQSVVVACRCFCVSRAALSAVDVCPTGTLREGGARSVNRVRAWHGDVLSWCCGGLFPRVSHHDAPLHISVKAARS